jgi:hypothetical protein
MKHSWIKLLDPRGLKPWLLVVAFGLNLLLMFLFFTAVASWLTQMGDWAQGIDILLMLGALLIAGGIAFGVTLLAKDRRGPGYGVLGAIGSFVLVIIMMYQSGLLALLVGLTALLGGYNGGMLGERVLMNRRQN